jgi:phytoene/squalene synthetase
VFLPLKVREGVQALYRFARAADNIADATTLRESEKREILQRVDDAFATGSINGLPGWAEPYFRLCQREGYRRTHGRDLLSAFLQDTRKIRYTDLNDLLDYCYRSAAPVGRAILEMAGEEFVDIEASDRLCIALQLLNHLQDVKEDYHLRDRVYLPKSWFEQAGVEIESLSSPFPPRELKEVMFRMLDVVDAQLQAAAPLMETIRSRRMRLYVTLVYGMACSLAAKLRREPFAVQKRVRLNRREMVMTTLARLREGWAYAARQQQEQPRYAY